MKLFTLTVLCLISISSGKGLPSIEQNAGKDSRIIGGSETSIIQFPYAAAIHVQTEDGKFFCGGTLYGNDWVITAGQCVDGAILFTIQFGSSTLEGDDPNRVTVATSDYFLHPDYDSATLAHDIGLIKLRISITHTDYVKAINVLKSEPMAIEITHYAIGWGQTSDSDDSLAERLNVVPVAPLSNQECRVIFGNQVTDEMVCIEGGYNQGICYGDTGTPLLETLKAGTAAIVAIASFISSNGCESTDPSGYTRIEPYYDWIISITEA